MKHLYVHVPFCRRRCSYCDFHIAVRRDVPAGAFVADLAAEQAVRGLALAPLDTVYLGGGTPSLLDAAALAALVARFPRAAGAEVTLEANPEDVTPSAAEAWAAAGITRVSLGVQSFAPDVLAWMHRPHGPEAPVAAMRTLRAAGFTNVSVDLIYGVPETLSRDLVGDLDRLLALAPEHVSAYGLTIEPRTPLGRWVAAGQVAPAPEERHAEEFHRVHDQLAAAGFDHYEVSNFALAGRESRHNRAYWSGAEYLGVGPAAHGFAGGERRWNTGAWPAWARAVRAGVDPVAGTERLTPAQRDLERVYLGLRTRWGVDPDDPALDPAQVTVAREQGWVAIGAGRLVATLEGWLVLDALIDRLTTSPVSG